MSDQKRGAPRQAKGGGIGGKSWLSICGSEGVLSEIQSNMLFAIFLWTTRCLVLDIINTTYDAKC